MLHFPDLVRISPGKHLLSQLNTLPIDKMIKIFYFNMLEKVDIVDPQDWLSQEKPTKICFIGKSLVIIMTQIIDVSTTHDIVRSKRKISVGVGYTQSFSDRKGKTKKLRLAIFLTTFLNEQNLGFF